MKKVIVAGVFTVIAAFVSGFFAHESVLYSEEQKMNNQLSQAITINLSEESFLLEEKGLDKNNERKDIIKITDVLYDGRNYRIYTKENMEVFSVGGKTYEDGFSLWNDNDKSDENATVYFNLDGKYSEMEFDIGRMNGSVENSTLLVTSNGGIYERLDLNGEIPDQHFVIELNQTKDLQMRLITNQKVEFGIFHIQFL